MPGPTSRRTATVKTLPDDVIRTVTNRSQGYYSVVTKFYSDSETNTT